MISNLLFWALSITGTVFFTIRILNFVNKSSKKEHEKQSLLETEEKYDWLKKKDIVIYYKLYNRTIDLLKTNNHNKFFVVFDQFFQKKYPELFEEYKQSKAEKETDFETNQEIEKETDFKVEKQVLSKGEQIFISILLVTLIIGIAAYQLSL